MTLHSLLLSGVIATSNLAALNLQGGGASFPAPLYMRWAQDYAAKSGTHVEYNSQGSGFGVKGIIDRTLDFAGSDAPLSKKERDLITDGEVVHIPSVAGAVVLTYNLPGYEGELQLTGEVIADVYVGKITHWNDPKIAALNDGKALPDRPITPIYRSDGSGTTFVFTSYMATQSQDFIKMTPPGKTITVKGGQGGKGNEGVSNQVKKIPGSFGYVELTYAMNESLPFASVRNKAGKFVKASPASVSAAGAGSEEKMKDGHLATHIWNSPAADAYPISAYTYLLVRKDLGYLGSEDKARGLVGFLTFALDAGQAATADLHYAPLPAGVRAKALQAVKGLTYNGKPLN